MSDLDVAIIGAGPAGLAASIECQHRNLSHVVIEKGSIVESLRKFPTNMVYFTTPDLLEIGELPLVSSREKPTRLEALKYYRRVAERYQLPLNLYEKVDAVERQNGLFRLDTTLQARQPGENRTYLARKLIVATGYYDNPNRLGVPGEDSPKVSHYYHEAHPYYQMNVAVVGGANSAAETALDLYRSGVNVTLIHWHAELSSHIKYWVRPDIDNRIERGEIRAFFNTRVEEILPDKLRLKTGDGRRFEIDNDFVLALIGYHPDYRLLESMGIEIEPEKGRPVHDPETLESNVPGLYVAGGMVSGRETNKIFIENGRFHGAKIVRHLAAHLQESR
ncbi:MAG TPA: YpdA family putative bacillithiol disulfide reductase [Vicinamibacteria bacterium]|jgi:thioredoxin reductase (NADPH)